MAHRHQEVVRAVTDSENLNAKPALKSQLLKQSAIIKVTKRPALNEVGNKPDAISNLEKKQEPIKDLKKKLVPKENATLKQVSATTTQSYSRQQLERIIDPDAESKNIPELVSEYVNDIFKHLRELEIKLPINKNFLEGHRSTPSMRVKLVDWLVAVHSNFKLCLETLYLCVSITDRYLQLNKSCGRETLQLVGTSALFIACKYEEMYFPEMGDFVYICDDAYSKTEILTMEQEILKKLDFFLGVPLTISFLRRFSKIAQVSLEHHNLAKYLIELALLDYDMCSVKPSIQAAAATCLALSILSDDPICPSKLWTPTLVYYTTYKYCDFKNVIIKFANILLKTATSKYSTIQDKYSSTKFSKISLNPKLNCQLVKKLAQQTSKS